MGQGPFQSCPRLVHCRNDIYNTRRRPGSVILEASREVCCWQSHPSGWQVLIQEQALDLRPLIDGSDKGLVFLFHPSPEVCYAGVLPKMPD